MTNPNSKFCPECGKQLPANSPHQLCAACLMAQALVSGTLPPIEGKPQVPSPTPEEIAAKFPQFDISQCLGRGGMGVVYKARQKSLDRWVAIKILAPERGGEARFAERFAREAATLAKLSHPSIVTIHDFGQTEDLFYLVMEFVDGVNLRDLLREGKLDSRQALAIVPPICEALQYAHDKGIVHRDIKPENLLLDREGRVKIADFGIAALVGAAGELAGTPPYMAPEQSEAKREVDHRADIYALGVVLYEMLTGQRPDKELVAPSRRVQIDVRLDEIVLRALEKKPELRFQQASLLKTQLETLSQQPPQAQQEPEAAPNAMTEQQQRDLRIKIYSVTFFCVFSSAGMASHLPASDPRFLIGAWSLIFLVATLAGLFAARKEGRKLLVVSKLADLNATGTLLALMACVDEIRWIQRPWIVVIEWVLAAGFLGSMALLFRGGVLPFSLQAQIWPHMSASEKRDVMLRNLMFIIWLLVTCFVSFFFVITRHMAYAGGVFALGISTVPLWTKILREGQAATAWATQRGITSEKIKQDSLNAVPRWVRLIFGPGVIGFYFALSSLAARVHWSTLAALSVWLIGCFGLTYLFVILVGGIFRRDQAPKAMSKLKLLSALLLGAVLLVIGISFAVEQERASAPEHEHGMKLAQGDLSVATSELERFHALGRAAKNAMKQGQFEKAKALASELLGLAQKYKDDWNYGNAIQDSNQVLGRIALLKGDVAEAKYRLLASAESKGSPQMNSFGPNMQLAKDLLDKGERDAVLEYFKRCSSFWAMGDEQLASWTASVEKGQIPKFGANLVY